MEGSAGGTGPCVVEEGEGVRGENRGGESLQEERSVRETEREREGREGRKEGGKGEMGALEVRG